jgi:hypothetical protein
MLVVTVIELFWYKTTEKETDMLETLFYILVGAFIGWNLPQPQYAKDLQDKVLSMLHKPQ